MFTTYAIINENNKIYIGHTANLEERLKRHNGALRNRMKSYTSKNKGNWKVFYKEEFDARKKAVEREKQLKSYQGRKFLRNIIENI